MITVRYISHFMQLSMVSVFFVRVQTLKNKGFSVVDLASSMDVSLVICKLIFKVQQVFVSKVKS
jgi:hypothetical protein